MIGNWTLPLEVVGVPCTEFWRNRTNLPGVSYGVGIRMSNNMLSSPSERNIGGVCCVFGCGVTVCGHGINASVEGVWCDVGVGVGYLLLGPNNNDFGCLFGIGVAEVVVSVNSLRPDVPCRIFILWYVLVGVWVSAHVWQQM